MTEAIPNFEPEPELQLTQANRAMQQQLMELNAVAQIVLHVQSQQLTLNARAYELFGLDPAGPQVSLEQAETLVHPEDLTIFFRAGERSHEMPGLTATGPSRSILTSFLLIWTGFPATRFFPEPRQAFSA